MMAILIVVLTVAFTPIFIALFGPSLWSLVKHLIWTALIHPSNQVIVLPGGWRRKAAWFVRPSKKPLPSEERDVS
ncbi:hypothetical protein [Sulfobacillus thermosulfidooxidans]|uniref:hypothetical protein n=1 Tax=Sulfobacillus thermosulfidooxidans TaxID=28034 RepID=UPI0011815797|nr:hypothetical protein [Sulfobacillus thermosulfidooxidans]